MNIHSDQNRVSMLIKNAMSLVAMTMMVSCLALPISAQEDEIEIVNQDGERVEGARLMVKPKLDPIELKDQTIPNQGGKDVLLKSENGKLTFTDSDGNEQQIDLNGAQSVVVQQSTQSVNNNGQQQTKVVGKAIVVDADGQRHEIDLGDNDGEGIVLPGIPGGFLKGFPNTFRAERTQNKYMIGVHCTKVAPALQAQLGLAEDTGLLVDAVGQGSPAEAAGLQKHDILLFADDQELITQEDLVRVVQKIGEADSALSLTVMRSGKEIGVDISPVERTADQMRLGFQFDADPFGAGGPFGNGFGDMEFKQFGPGVIVGGDFDDRIENMREQMQQVQQQMQEMQQRFRQQIETGE